MPQLFYQPLGLPGAGSATNNIAQVADIIGSGTTSLSSGFTRLGERLNAKAAAERARQEAGVKEQISLLASQATTEDEVASLAANLARLQAGGAAPQGPAAAAGNSTNKTNSPSSTAAAALGLGDIVSDARKTVLDNAGVRGANLKTDLENQGSQLKLDVANRFDDAQTKFGPQITEVNRLMDLGQEEQALALRQETLGQISNEFGSDVANNFIADTRGAQTLGDDTRSKIKTNALGIKETEQSISITGAEASDSNRLRDYNFSRGVLTDERSDKTYNDGQLVEGAVARAATGSYDIDTARQNIINDETLSTPLRVKALSAVNQLARENPNFLDDYNPTDPAAKENYLYAPGEKIQSVLPNFPEELLAPLGPSDSRLDIPSTVRSVQAVKSTLEKTKPSLAIYNEVQAYEKTLGEGGNITNLGQFIEDTHQGVKLPDKWLNRIERAQKGKPGQRALTDAEVMVIADRSIKARGLNIGGVNIIPGNERADERILDVDEFDRIADEYRKQNVGDLAAEASVINDFSNRAATLGNKIGELQKARQRAIESGDTAARNQYDKRIVDAQKELTGISRSMNKAVGADPATPKEEIQQDLLGLRK